MAAALTSTIQVTSSWNFTNPLTLSTPAESASLAYSKSLANGTGADQVNSVWADERTLATATDDVLDLSGSLVNAFGTTIVFTKIKKVFVYNVGANDAGVYTEQDGENLHIGVGSSNTLGTNGLATMFTVAGANGITAGCRIHSGGVFLNTAPRTGYTVTAGTGDLLRIRNDGTKTIKYRVEIEGCV